MKLVSDRKTATISKLRKKGLEVKQISLHLTLNFISREPWFLPMLPEEPPTRRWNL